MLKFSRSLYLGNDLSESIHTWTIDSMTSDPRVHAEGGGGGGYMSKSSTSSKTRIFVLKFSRSLYLCNHLSERIHSWTIGTQYG